MSDLLFSRPGSPNNVIVQPGACMAKLQFIVKNPMLKMIVIHFSLCPEEDTNLPHAKSQTLMKNCNLEAECILSGQAYRN
jgi:hypothetical protein